MKNTIKHLLSIVFFLLLVNSVSSQVNGVNYWMKFNSDSLWYDCYFIVNNGTATGIDKIAFFSQFSLVVNHGDSLKVVKNYSPIEQNGDTANWVISSIIKSPAVQPQNDFYGIVPQMGLSFYPDLYPGDTIKLFSIKRIGQTSSCGKEIRIFENGVDPDSSDDGMSGSDFGNGFIIGSASNEVYEGNSEQLLALSPTIHSAVASCTAGIEIDLTANSNGNQGPLTFHWTGPNGYSSTSEDVTIVPATVGNNGLYKIIVTDSIGCKDSLEVEGLSKPDAGSDQLVCAGTTNIVYGNPLNGQWSNLTNPIGAIRTNISPGIDQIAFTNMASGEYRFKYSIGNSGSCSDTIQFNVNSLPNISMNANNTCIGDTIPSVLIANGTGNWTSSDPTVASVLSVSGQSGSIVGHSAGVVNFTFTSSNTGCHNTTAFFTVNPNPIVSINNDTRCVGLTSQASPGTGGIWQSYNATIATITNSGIINAINPGQTTFHFTDNNGCSTETEIFTVAAIPLLTYDSSAMCVGEARQFLSNQDGAWTSSTPTVASIDNNGLVTALTTGSSSFQFTNVSSGCSNTSDSIYVNSISISEFADVCIGATLNLNHGGTWTSSNTAVVIINPNTNTLTAVSEGESIITFTEIVTGCSDSKTLRVIGKPVVNILGSAAICFGESTFLSANTSGTWTSLNPLIASINNSGKVTAISEGNVLFIFTAAGGCSSDPITIVVFSNPIISLPKNKIEINETIQVNANTTIVTWESLYDHIATINTQGLVTGISKGKTIIYGYDSNGCATDSVNIEVTDYKYTLTGFCFTDLNQNDIFDDEEDFPLSNCVISRSGSSTIYYTDADGYFNFEVDSALNEVNFSINFGSWQSNSIDRTININKPVTYAFVGFKPLANAGHAASVSLSSSTPVCNSFANLNPIAFNEGSTLLDGYLVIEYDDRTYFSETHPLPSGGNGNKLIWDFKKLAPGKIFSPTIQYFVPEVIVSPDSLHFKAWVLEKTSGDTLNTFDYSIEILCDTSSSNIVSETWPDRPGKDNYTLLSESINYNITYANNGNGIARKVILETVIDEHLDENSLIIKESSYPYQASRIGNVLTIIIDNIELGSTRSGESGTISYAFKIKPGTPDKTKIINSIEIEMDNGYKITTQPTLNTIVSILPCDLLHDEIIQVNEGLTVSSEGNLFSWFDCNNHELLQSDVNPIFQPLQNGNYFVIIEGEQCKTITDCYAYVETHTTDQYSLPITVYPNPTNAVINIEGLQSNQNLMLLNYRGEKIKNCTCTQLDLTEFDTGIYFVIVEGNQTLQMVKVMKL